MATEKRNIGNVETFIGGELHGLIFLEEFVFPSRKFLKPDKSEVEFADAVVVLGDALLVCQIKEREYGSIRDAEVERRWFERTVMKKATKQIRDTLSYLSNFDDIPVSNARGRVFNLAANSYEAVIKIVLYGAAQACRTSAGRFVITSVDRRLDSHSRRRRLPRTHPYLARAGGGCALLRLSRTSAGKS